MVGISVTDLHICQRCPRLLAYKQSGETSVFSIGLNHSCLPGKKFHKIAEIFHKDISGNGDNQKKELFLNCLKNHINDLPNQIHDFLCYNYFENFYINNSNSMSEKQALCLARGINKWGSYICDLLSPSLGDFKNLNEILDLVFHNAEYSFDHDYCFSDGFKINIRGRPDALLFDPIKKESVLLEFKGLKISDLSEEVVQTSLYSWIIYKKTGSIPRVDILYLEEDNPLISYPAEKIRITFNNIPILLSLAREIIEQKRPIPRANNIQLCNNCSFKQKCDFDWGSNLIEKTKDNLKSLENINSINQLDSGINKDSNENDKATLNQEAEMILEKLVNTLSKFRIDVIDDGYIIAPRFYRLKIIPDISKGVTVNKIQNKVNDIQVALRLDSPPIIQPQRGYVSIDVPRNNNDSFSVNSLITKGLSLKPNSEATFPIGIGINGSVFWIDFSEPTMTSILIGGTSGSGKSVLLRSIIVGLGICSPKDSLQFTLIDPKRVTFTDFTNIPIFENSIIMDADLALTRLNSLVEEMESRYKIFEKLKVHDFLSYNLISEQKLKRHLIIIDEYADLMTDSVTKKELETFIKRIGQKGRAAGFHIVIATQRPDSTVVTGIIKANLQLKICLKVTNQSNSRIILDEGGGESLLGYGDMLIGGTTTIQRYQCPMVTKNDLNELFKKISH